MKVAGYDVPVLESALKPTVLEIGLDTGQEKKPEKSMNRTTSRAGSENRILISGAGVAGLTCALWLARKGFNPVIVEKARRIRAGGFLVSLSHHAYHFAEDLGVLPALKERSAGIQASSYHDGTGRPLLRLII